MYELEIKHWAIFFFFNLNKIKNIIFETPYWYQISIGLESNRVFIYIFFSNFFNVLK